MLTAAATRLSYIRGEEMSVSNLDHDTDYDTDFFVVFLSYSKHVIV